jgi:predicted TIM-barrel fold metal-dependent hydrolase
MKWRSMSDSIDVDLVVERADVPQIAPHLRREWSEYLGLGGDWSTHGTFRFALPGSTYEDPQAPAGSGPGDRDPREWLDEHLRRHRISAAILNPGTAASLSGMNATDLAIEFARATNDWTIQQWLADDERLLGSIVVAPQDPPAAAAEIRRVGGHPRIVQVTLARPREFLGHRSLTPIWEAANELGLAVNLQGNAAFVGINRGYATDGHPSSMYEYRLTDTYGAQPHLISVIAAGVFDRYPNVRLVINGFGVAWLPSVVWAMDAAWRVEDPERRELPRLPSEYVRDHVGFGTRGVELPDDPADLVRLLSLIDAGRLLMLSTAGGEPPSLEGFDQSARERILFNNARGLYRLDCPRRSPIDTTPAREMGAQA